MGGKLKTRKRIKTLQKIQEMENSAIDYTTAEIASALDVSKATVSNYRKVLRKEGLIGSLKKRRKPSEETRKNMVFGWRKRKQRSGYAAEQKRLSERFLGKRLSKEHKKNLVVGWTKRKQGSDYVAERKRHSEFMKIRNNNPKWKKHMVEAQKKWYAAGNKHPMKGKHWSTEIRRKMSLGSMGIEPPNKGKPMSENSKRKVSSSLLKKYADGYVNPTKDAYQHQHKLKPKFTE
jgi:predicted transcriptional regulator